MWKQPRDERGRRNIKKGRRMANFEGQKGSKRKGTRDGRSRRKKNEEYRNTVGHQLARTTKTLESGTSKGGEQSRGG